MALILPSLALSKKFVGVDSNYKPNRLRHTNTEKSYHAFTIGSIGLLIPAEMTSEFSDGLAYCYLPNTNTILYGMANLRGNIIPVFDLYDQLAHGCQSNVDFWNSKELWKLLDI